jgi:RNA polymerase primary sigma factor
MYSQTPGSIICFPQAGNTAVMSTFPGSPKARSEARKPLRRAVPSADVKPAQHRDRVVTLQPAVRPPRPRDLDRLCEADRYLIGKLLAEPFVYVDHPLFEEANAEVVLFGEPATLVGDVTYFTEPEGAGPAELGSSVLDAASERLLFQRFNYARMRVAQLLRKHQGRCMPRTGLQHSLAWLHRALMIRGRLTQANIRLVLSMAKRPQFRSLDPNEVVSAGNFALLRSIDRFDCSRGYKFSTYACQSILQRILHVVDSTRRYRNRFVSEFEQTLERDDSALRRHEAQAAEWVDDLRDILAGNRAGLTSLEHAVIQRRFGFAGVSESGKPMTLKEVGALMGVTKERIRQIQNRAIGKLRSALERDCLLV